MLSRLDDFLSHQICSTMDHVGDGDPRWFDRFWFNAHSIDGEMAVSQGIGVYPNMNVMDGFAIVVREGRQRNVRASRELRHDRDVMSIGPLLAEVGDGLRRWRFALAENDQGAGYELEFTAAFAPIEAKRFFSRVKNRVVIDWCHFVQAGRVRGKVTVDGRSFDVAPERWWGGRDRSWGVRPGVGVVEEWSASLTQAGWGTRFNWVCAQLPSFHLWYFITHEEDGTQKFFEGWLRHPEGDRRGVVSVAGVRRSLDVDSTGRFRSAEITLQTASGEEIPLTVRRLATTVYLRGGLYGGWNGAFHGMPRGALHVEGDTWEQRDPALLGRIAGINDHVCEFSAGAERGYGIFELGYGT